MLKMKILVAVLEVIRDNTSDQIEGAPRAYSQFSVPYITFAVISRLPDGSLITRAHNPETILIGSFVGAVKAWLDEQKSNGDIIVWRIHPQIDERMVQYDGDDWHGAGEYVETKLRFRAHMITQAEVDKPRPEIEPSDGVDKVLP
jgi:hypothetical protein